jgi:hypothetical protein
VDSIRFFGFPEADAHPDRLIHAQVSLLNRCTIPAVTGAKIIKDQYKNFTYKPLLNQLQLRN